MYLNGFYELPLALPPHHLIDHASVGLDDLDHLGGDIFLNVVGDGDAIAAVTVHFHGSLHGLYQTVALDARQHEAALVQRLGALGDWFHRPSEDYRYPAM